MGRRARQIATAQVDADILVMGAYGHSRLRGFLLGGATEQLLHQSPTALWMAHA